MVAIGRSGGAASGEGSLGRGLWRACLSACLSLALVLLMAQPSLAIYRLDYGDAVAVTVMGHPEYSVSAAIRNDGMISVPHCGDVVAIGLTPEALGARVKALVVRYVREPIVFCVVTGTRPRVIYVLGQVRSPGRLELSRANPTILDAIAGAGGFTNRAVDDHVAIMRGEGEAVERTYVNVKRMLRTGDFSGNVPILPGDKVMVEEVWWPDVFAISAAVAPIIAVIGMISFFANLYGTLSAPRE